ncbi:hypothetical protein IAT38_000638 [Cryptococcus sp. DSM 104549]
MTTASRLARTFTPLARARPATPLQRLPLVPPPACARRTFFSFRRTSFWAPTQPPDNSPIIPLTPPSPGAADGYYHDHEPPRPQAPSGKSGNRKQRYLESLMDRAGELSLRCSILDAQGNWGTQMEKYQKSELCREYDLDPRDLRKLDSVSPNLVPVILTRKTCILISMLHLRVLIKPDRVIVFESVGAQGQETQRRFKFHLERNIKVGLGMKEEMEHNEETWLSYEHRALESVLVATANALEEEMAFTRHLVKHLLADLEDHIDRENLKKLLHYQRKIVGFQSKARYVKSSVDELLDSDEDLSAMYLTSRAEGRPRALHDHEQLELLLESFEKQVEEIVSEVDTTVANMNSTQEIAELMLDSGRNALLALDIKISIATLGIGTGALVAGLFGMNLTSYLEETPYAFFGISATATLIALLITAYGLKVLRRVRRVALSGRNPAALSSILSSPSWDSSVAQFSQGFDPALVNRRAEMARRRIWERLFWRRSAEPRGDKWTRAMWMAKKVGYGGGSAPQRVPMPPVVGDRWGVKGTQGQGGGAGVPGMGNEEWWMLGEAAREMYRKDSWDLKHWQEHGHGKP